MSYPNDQVAELKLFCTGLEQGDELGRTYFLLPGLNLPDGCTPACIDALLCPTERDGYPSRLFFATRIQSRANNLNWNATDVRILERNWSTFSWKVSPNLRLAQMVAAHLKGLR